jgi:hypothetical protein
MSARSLWYDRNGNPISVAEWTELFHTAEYKQVQVTEGGGVRVSTVWLGIDHGFGNAARPLIFETMVFGGGHDQEQWRYATEQEARAGHAEVCSAVFDELPLN